MFGFGVVLYLFLAGLGAGLYLSAYVLGLVFNSGSRCPRDLNLLNQKIQVVVLVCVGVAGLFLLSDLGRPERFVLVFKKLGTSILSLGALLLVAFLAAVAVHAPVRPTGRPWMRSASAALGVLIAILAVGIIVYTGCFLMQLRAVPFWGSPLVVAIFSLSAISSGLAMYVLLATVSLRRRQLPSMARVALLADHYCLVIELVLLIIFIVMMAGGTDAAAQSCQRLLTGDLSWAFWPAVILGLVVPLFAGFARVRTTHFVLMIECLCVLFGCLALRYCIIEAGVRSFAM